jgi:hypothetical protein
MTGFLKILIKNKVSPQWHVSKGMTEAIFTQKKTLYNQIIMQLIFESFKMDVEFQIYKVTLLYTQTLK